MPDPGLSALPTTQVLRTLQLPATRVRVVTILNTGAATGPGGGLGSGSSYHVDELFPTDFTAHRHDSFVSILARDQLMQEKYVIMEFDNVPSKVWEYGVLNLNIYGEEAQWIADFDGQSGVGYLTYNYGQELTEALVDVFKVSAITSGDFASSYIPRHLLTDLWTSKDLTREDNTEPHNSEFPFDSKPIIGASKLTLLIAFQDYRIGQFVGAPNSMKQIGIDPAGCFITLDYWDNSGINGFCSDGGLTCDGEKLFMQWNFITNGDGEVQPTDMELALLSTPSFTDQMGTELVGGGYARVSLPTGPINGDATLAFYQNPSNVVFAPAGADWSVYGWAIIDSEGRWLFYGNLAEPVLVREGVSFTINKDDLRIQMYRICDTTTESFRFLRALFTRDDTLANIYPDFADTPRLFQYTVYHVEADKELCTPASRPLIAIELSPDGHTATNTTQINFTASTAGEADWWRLYRNTGGSLLSTSGLHGLSDPPTLVTVGDQLTVMALNMRIRAN